MGSILIVMPRLEESVRIANIIREFFPHLTIDSCNTAAEALRLSHARDYGLVICTRRIKEISYTEFHEYLPDNFGMIILTKDPMLETYSQRMIKLIMPFKKRELISTIEMMTERFQYNRRKKKKAPPKRNPQEQRIIDEAKAMLMEKHGMSEPEAFRYIQKNSMDYGRTMVESAQMLLMIHDSI